MRFTRDRRGQSVVVGTVILFGFLILALASYQAFAVPAQNNQAEFEHSQDVQSDMEDLRASLLDVRDARQDPYQRPVRVSLGTRYNSRLFTVNPPRPEGSLTTQDRGNLSISGANVVNQDFDNTEPLFDREHRTRLLTYRPNYNEYRNPPRTTFEHSLLYNRFEGANRTVTGQRTIDGDDRQLSLVAYSNDIDRQGLSTTIDPETIDGPTPTIPIEGDDGTFTVTLPTHSPSVWTDLIGNTTDTGELNARVVDNTTQSVTVELEGEWNLQMARVGYEGRTVDKTPFSNVTRIDDERAAGNISRTFNVEWDKSEPVRIVEGETDNVPVVVTDRESGDPIEAASIDASFVTTAGSGTLTPIVDEDTNPFGRTTVVFDASEASAGDEFDVYASSGDDVDRIAVEIIEEGEGTMADRASIEDGVYEPFGGANSEIEFTIVNAEGGESIITDVRIDSTNTGATFVNNQGAGSTFRTDGGTTLFEDRIDIGSTDAETVSINDLAIADDDDIAVLLGQFRTGQDNPGRVNMQSQQVTITLFFDDDSQETFTIQAE